MSKHALRLLWSRILSLKFGPRKARFSVLTTSDQACQRVGSRRVRSRSTYPGIFGPGRAAPLPLGPILVPGPGWAEKSSGRVTSGSPGLLKHNFGERHLKFNHCVQFMEGTVAFGCKCAVIIIIVFAVVLTFLFDLLAEFFTSFLKRPWFVEVDICQFCMTLLKCDFL